MDTSGKGFADPGDGESSLAVTHNADRESGSSAVLSYNEWDPLEEVIVGTVQGAARMAYEPAFAAYFSAEQIDQDHRGGPFHRDEIEEAEAQLEGLVKILQDRGITVRRPDLLTYDVAQCTPDFFTPFGNCAACPRDILLIVGDEVIEAPMAQRGRFFEYRAYRTLVKEYFRGGARWTTAPKPLMADSLYVADYSTAGRPFDLDDNPGITEFEPCFDAACFVRLGRDIFWQPDLVSNRFGFEWLHRHLGDRFRLHVAEFHDPVPMHIDATLVPIRPGLVLINPVRPCKDQTEKLFLDNGWDLLEGPASVRTGKYPARGVSNWVSLNILSLDPKTVVVEAAEEPLMELLARNGVEAIPCPFDKVFKFGGSFHCCTVDVRRKGQLESYFPGLD